MVEELFFVENALKLVSRTEHLQQLERIFGANGIPHTCHTCNDTGVMTYT